MWIIVRVSVRLSSEFKEAGAESACTRGPPLLNDTSGREMLLCSCLKARNSL